MSSILYSRRSPVVLSKLLLTSSILPFSSRTSSRVRFFSKSSQWREIRDAAALPEYTLPTYEETSSNSLSSLRWPAPPRNILLVKKEFSPEITNSLILAAKYIYSNFPGVSIVLEPSAAEEVHERVDFPIYTPKICTQTTLDTDTPKTQESGTNSIYQQKIDLICTFGGDGTILHASSLFATSSRVPPMIPFSMGTLGFLGGWSFGERKRAFREVYMSGSDRQSAAALEGSCSSSLERSVPSLSPPLSSPVVSSTRGWTAVHGYSCGSRTARVLVRHRLQVSLFQESNSATPWSNTSRTVLEPPTFAMNEVLLHRGSNPHLAVLSISIGGHFLTDAIADGVIISTPTGSTAYSLSSGGAIVHPVVPALLITPVCPRSLSFRPLVLPASTPVEIRLGPAARASSIELSVDGQVKRAGVERGVVVGVQGEEARDGVGGVPTVVRGAMGDRYGLEGDRDAHWVGGLNGLLKFNYPFGEEKE